MEKTIPDDPQGAVVIKTECVDESSPSGLKVLNGGLSSDMQDRIYIPPGFSPVKGEPNDELEGTPGEQLLQEDIGDVSFEEADLPQCMLECCYCKILFMESEMLGQHLKEAHQCMEDIDSTLEKLATNAKAYQVETKAKSLLEEDGSRKGQCKKRRTYKDLQIMCDYPGCGKTFIRRGALQTHRVVHEVSKACPHCGLEFKTITALLRHIDRRHNIVKARRIDCTYPGCNKTFRNPLALKTHQLVHDEDKRCCICGMVFIMVATLQRHMTDVHPTPGDRSGTKCGQQITPGVVERHRRCKNRNATVENDTEVTEEGVGCDTDDGKEVESMDYTCPHEGCTLVFESKQKLVWHLKYTRHHKSQHSNHPFHCPYKVCKLFFKNKDALCNHMKAEHWGTKKIKTAAAAKLAKEAREARIKPERPGTQRKCPVCCETFANESKMKHHLKKQHSRETGFDADQAESQVLTEPVAKPSEPVKATGDTANNDLVFDLQMFKCPMCHAAYHTMSGLKYHFQHHHGCETALSHLCRLENGSEGFVSIVPATLYGDSFKSRKRRAASKSRALEKSPEKFRSPPEKSLEKLRLLKKSQEKFDAPVQNSPEKLMVSPKKSSEKLTALPKESPEKLTVRAKESSEKLTVRTKESSEMGTFSLRKESQNRSKSDYSESDNDSPIDLSKHSNVSDERVETGIKGKSTIDNCVEIDVDRLEEDSNAQGYLVIEPDERDKDSDLGKNDKGGDGTEVAEETADDAANSGKRGNPMCRYPSCFKVFRNRFELMRHQRTHEKLLKCPHTGCDQGFFNSNNLRLHIQLVHAELQDTKCKDCGILGKRSYIIYRHPKYCPKTVDLKCPECGKAFEKVSSFTNHVRSHAKKVRCNYPCEYDGCVKKFRTRQDRTRHHNVHSGARPHVCPYANCDKTYKQRPHLLVHLKASHTIRKDEDRKTFTCEHCGSIFKHSCGRLKHIRKSCMQGPNRQYILAHRKRRPTTKSKS